MLTYNAASQQEHYNRKGKNLNVKGQQKGYHIFEATRRVMCPPRFPLQWIVLKKKKRKEEEFSVSNYTSTISTLIFGVILS